MVEGDAGGAGGDQEAAGVVAEAAVDVEVLPSFIAEVRYLEKGSSFRYVRRSSLVYITIYKQHHSLKAAKDYPF